MARPLSKAARETMLTAATELLLDVGLRSFTVDELARRSGVAKTTIYRHFPNTKELIVLAVDRSVTYIDPPDTGTLEGDIRETLVGILPNFANRKANALFLDMLSAAALDADYQKHYDELERATPSPVITVLHRWQQRGEISAHIDIPTAFEIIDGPFLLRSILFPDTLQNVDIEELTRRIVLQLRP